MYPIFFSLGRVNFYTHGLMIALGCLIGGYLIFYLAKQERLPRKFLFDLLVFSLFAGIIGARIAYVILYYYQFQNWHEMLLVWYGGLVSYGGIILGFLVAGLILRKKRQNVLQWFDIGIIGLLLGWVFGRVGCLLSGDTPGLTSLAKIAIWGQIPVALFEAIWSFILAGVLFYFYRYQREFIRKFGNGFIFFSGIALYSLGRFIIDFWRQDSMLYFLKAGQAVSLVVFIGTILILSIYYFRKRKGDNYAGENL